MLDYHIEDLYHFKYIDDKYQPVKTTFDLATHEYKDEILSLAPICSVYVTDYL